MFVLNEDLILPENLRKKFKIAYGQIYSSVENIRKIIDGRCVITIGDRISFNILKCGYKPKLIVFDGKEKKTDVPNEIKFKLESFKSKTYKIRNPPGTVTKELWASIRNSLDDKDTGKIIIDGEEDMAFLPAVLEAEIGSYILYGFFDKGFVLTDVNNDIKKKMKDLFNKFERVDSSAW